jgi:Immunity protein 40
MVFFERYQANLGKMTAAAAGVSSPRAATKDFFAGTKYSDKMAAQMKEKGVFEIIKDPDGTITHWFSGRIDSDMSAVWSAKADAILSAGSSLSSVGVRNWGLRRAQALTAIDQLASEGIPILGIDIYELTGELPQLSYDNWHCDRAPGESEESFVGRSTARARTYVSTYRPSEDQRVLFAVIPGVQSEV